MELIHADAGRSEIGIVRDMESFDAEISILRDAGEAGNSWQLKLGADMWLSRPIYKGHYLYINNTEWGGPVEKISHNTREGVITLSGCTWRGMLARKVICPPDGKAYLTFNQTPADRLIRAVVEPQLGGLFSVPKQNGPIVSASFRFETMLRGLIRVIPGLDIVYNAASRMAEIHIRELIDYADTIDLSQDYGMDLVTTSGSLTGYNHLIALGRGELTERTVIHLYRLDDGTITQDRPDWAGTVVDRVAVYDYANAETPEELLKDATNKLQEYTPMDSLELDASELDIPAKLGDTVGTRDRLTGMAGKAPITSMILKMNDSGITIEKRVG